MQDPFKSIDPVRVTMRLDATAAIGWGHLKRCLSLASALMEEGARVGVVGRSDSPAVALAAMAAGVDWHELPAGAHDVASDAAATHLLAPAPIVVVDHYGLDRRWHDAMRQAGSARIVVIDDLADRPLSPDLLIDSNPADHTAKYAAVMAPNIEICGGPAYALLDAVYALHARSQSRASVERIAIFMGGTDPTGHTGWVLNLLRHRVGWQGEVRIATTSANRRHQELAQQVAKDDQALLLTDLPNLADFHADCDLQIGAGGGAIWERCCLGVPTVALICADNQRLAVPWGDRAGVMIGIDAMGQSEEQAEAVTEAVQSLISSASQRGRLRERSMSLVDGRGAERAARRVLGLQCLDLEVR